MKILGIKKIKSQKTDKIYVTFYCSKRFTDYEVGNSLYIEGLAVEVVTAGEDFGLKVGDDVTFYYGKAIGDYQPVVDVKINPPTK